MAQMTPGFTLVGPISNLSAYKRRGSDKIIVRMKGGPSKDQIKRSPAFEKLRKINVEFGGRSTAGKWIRQGLEPLTPLADYNISSSLTALLKPVQELDTTSESGKRHVLLSQQPNLLAGFSLNRNYPFDSMVRNPLGFSISRESQSAYVDIPALLPGINLQVPGKHPLYSLVAVLALVPDLYFDGNKYVPDADYTTIYTKTTESPWHPLLSGSPAMRLEISLPSPSPVKTYSLMLSIGLRLGTVIEGGAVQQVPHVGSAKILGLV